MKIGIPAINSGALLLKCVRSIDYPIERLLIVANRWGDEMEKSLACAIDTLRTELLPNILALEIHEVPGNLGASGSMNYIISHLGPCIVVCNDASFAPGTLAKCLAFIEERADCGLHYLLYMSAFHVSQRFINEIGYLDENFWPWGWDDIDLSYRLRKYQFPTAVFPRTDGQIIHDHPTQSVRSSAPRLQRWMRRMARMNAALGIKKWGIRQEQLFMLNKKNKWAIDPNALSDAGNRWVLDEAARKARIALLLEKTGIATQFVYSSNSNIVAH
ncbi:MAG: hypothetical protein P4L99_05845 [Chthoniobacter sp.]|nr:hypothetical protein [Chthoniobacter sp.]